MKAMKTLLASVAVLTAVAASPALAQDAYEAQAQVAQDRFYDASANTARSGRLHAQNTRRHSPNAAWDVYDTSGQYIGSDPDPLVRDSMLRESRGGE